MATVTLLEKARQNRLDALASLGSSKKSSRDRSFTSIFDFAFDAQDEDATLVAANNVIAFRSARNDLVAANDHAEPERIAA